MIQKISAYLLGMAQFRSSVTTHYSDCDAAHAYDSGREMAHRLTLRRYDQ